MIIKKANKSNLKEITILMRKELSKQPFNERDSINSIMKSLSFYLKKAYVYFIADKKIIGVVVFQIEQWWEGKVIIIQDLIIKEESNKMGLERKLMKFVEKYAKRVKAKRIYFETNKKSKAVKFYQELYYKINKNRISMSKKIK